MAIAILATQSFCDFTTSIASAVAMEGEKGKVT